MSQAQSFLDEITAAVAETQLDLEAFSDLFRTLTEADGTEVRNDLREAVTKTEARLRELNETAKAIRRLQDTGYPDPVPVPMSSDSTGRALAQATSVNRAIARITGQSDDIPGAQVMANQLEAAAADLRQSSAKLQAARDQLPSTT